MLRSGEVTVPSEKVASSDDVSQQTAMVTSMTVRYAKIFHSAMNLTMENGEMMFQKVASVLLSSEQNNGNAKKNLNLSKDSEEWRRFWLRVGRKNYKPR